MRILYFILLSALIFSCNTGEKKPSDPSGGRGDKKPPKQLNISILWDLSDRINPTVNNVMPSHAERDISVIRYFSDYFKTDMDKRGAYSSKGKIKVFFSPNPGDPNINTLASKLDIDLANKDVKEKKAIYDRIATDFENTCKQITDITIKSSKWEGSDIYRFFKNDVVDYCVSKDTSYRNILVILTDGYIYDKQSMLRAGNKSTYILPQVLVSLGLRNNPDFRNTFKNKDCGLISTRSDLNNLEILVLEINSEENHKDDEDIIKLYLQKWFTDMNVKRYEIYNSDLPDHTKKRIADFMNY